MYRLYLFIIVALLGGVIGWFLAQQQTSSTGQQGSETSHHSATANGTEPKIKFYQCSMDPQIISDKPSKCTICGMNLAPIYEDSGTESQNIDTTKLSESISSVIGVASAPARVDSLRRTLRIAGVISNDETQQRILSARVPGRIEKLHINQVGVEVVHNQPLAVIYSPDVLTAQRLYLENFRLGKTGVKAISISEIATSREKLLALGLADEDIKHLEETDKPDSMLILRAPFDGTVVTRKVYEGQYVNVNDELFEIGDFSSLWFIFDAYERDLPLLKLNQPVTVIFASLPGENVTAPITFIDPNLNETTRTARIRVVLNNPQRRILHRQTANGMVHIETEPALLIPRSAVLYTHEKPAAYVDLGGGAYQFRQLELGKTGDSDVEILGGIEEGEKVVTQAALLIDSQSQLSHFATVKEETEKPTEQESPLSKLTEPVILPEHFVRTMISVTSALSSDNLAEYQKILPDLLEAFHQLPQEVHDILTPFAKKLVSGKNLKEARQPFEPFSNIVADIVRKQPAAVRQAKIFQCPMSPVLGTARWIQDNNVETRNPFFGSEMLNCGVELQ
jgi:Cu(I)/Ag(I) efflux system membrane fusion protein